MDRETPASKGNKASVDTTDNTLVLVMHGAETSGGIRRNGDQDVSQ